MLKKDKEVENKELWMEQNEIEKIVEKGEKRIDGIEENVLEGKQHLLASSRKKSKTRSKIEVA